MNERAAAPATLLVENAALYTPGAVWPRGWLFVEDRKIWGLGPGEPPPFAAGRVARRVDAQGEALLPGFVDLHAHGAVGYEAMDANPEGLREMARFYARHGVTALLPTTWTGARAVIDGALAAIAECAGRVQGGATILGAHLEGPYLNAQKCGAQDSRYIRRAEREEALDWLDTDLVRLMALAPEFEENGWLIDECARRGITVSAAHTTAGYEELAWAVSRGLRQVTHCFNAMVGLGHRELGTVGAAMALPEINCELIADNLHVHPAVINILVQVKGPGSVILITDAIRGAGMPEGEYAIDDRTVIVRGGAVRLPDGTLAGSILTMERALANAVAATGRRLAELWPMSSLNAARAIGVTSKGSLEVGRDADIVLLDGDYEVVLTVAEGEIVYERDGKAT
jgi:N-acetylglucosamine-6-phosphate deacetylase